LFCIVLSKIVKKKDYCILKRIWILNFSIRDNNNTIFTKNQQKHNNALNNVIINIVLLLLKVKTLFY